MEVGKRTKLEENCWSSGVKMKEEYGECFGCFDLQDKINEANKKCAYLESDVEKKTSVIECLESKVGFMELENIEFLDEVRKLKQRNEELEKSIRDSEEQEKLTLVMIENEVLTCEKRKAESDLEVWKLKCKEMEARVMELEKKLAVGTTMAGLDLQQMCSGKINDRSNFEGGQPSGVQTATKDEANHVNGWRVESRPAISALSDHSGDMDGFKEGRKCVTKSTVRKGLYFAAEKSPLQKLSPSIPGSRPPLEPIYIGDSDDDVDDVHVSLPDVNRVKQRKVQSSRGVALESDDVVELPMKNKHEPIAEHQSDEEKTSCSTVGKPFRMHKKRKVRTGIAQIVSSDSETDDNIPISRLTRCSNTKLMKKRSVHGSCSGDNLRKVTPRRRLLRVGDIKDKSVPGKSQRRSAGNQRNIKISENVYDTVLEDEIEKDESSSEGESLGDFIVEDTDVSDCDSGSNFNDMSEHDGSLYGDSSEKSESASGGSIGYNEIISSFRRGRKNKRKWEYESDMLADFGKSAELCMKAVCALYRRQTCEEKSCKATLHRNGRGFNQIHAASGTALAEFLLDGDPHGEMNKTVEELQNVFPDGVNECRELATYYSKQVFEIYIKEEDPFLHP